MRVSLNFVIGMKTVCRWKDNHGESRTVLRRFLFCVKDQVRILIFYDIFLTVILNEWCEYSYFMIYFSLLFWMSGANTHILWYISHCYFEWVVWIIIFYDIFLTVILNEWCKYSYFIIYFSLLFWMSGANTHILWYRPISHCYFEWVVQILIFYYIFPTVILNERCEYSYFMIYFSLLFWMSGANNHILWYISHCYFEWVVRIIIFYDIFLTVILNEWVYYRPMNVKRPNDDVRLFIAFLNSHFKNLIPSNTLCSFSECRPLDDGHWLTRLFLNQSIIFFSGGGGGEICVDMVPMIGTTFVLVLFIFQLDELAKLFKTYKYV